MRADGYDVAARRALAVAIAVLLLAGSGAAGARASGARPPATWDPQVVPLVRFVEEQRGHHFRRPVDIEYLGDREFVAALGTDRYVGVYWPASERILVQGDPLAPFTRVTVVHELTHALDDQWLSLDALGDTRTARHAAAEATASRVESAFLATLGPTDTAAYDAEVVRRANERRRRSVSDQR